MSYAYRVPDAGEQVSNGIGVHDTNALSRLPTGLGDARDLALQGQLTEAYAA
jgi:hypothetical protein